MPRTRSTTFVRESDMASSGEQKHVGSTKRNRISAEWIAPSASPVKLLRSPADRFKPKRKQKRTALPLSCKGNSRLTNGRRNGWCRGSDARSHSSARKVDVGPGSVGCEAEGVVSGVLAVAQRQRLGKPTHPWPSRAGRESGRTEDHSMAHDPRYNPSGGESWGHYYQVAVNLAKNGRTERERKLGRERAIRAAHKLGIPVPSFAGGTPFRARWDGVGGEMGRSW